MGEHGVSQGMGARPTVRWHRPSRRSRSKAIFLRSRRQAISRLATGLFGSCPTSTARPPHSSAPSIAAFCWSAWPAVEMRTGDDEDDQPRAAVAAAPAHRHLAALAAGDQCRQVRILRVVAGFAPHVHPQDRARCRQVNIHRLSLIVCRRSIRESRDSTGISVRLLFRCGQAARPEQMAGTGPPPPVKQAQ
jgi:hypothetical protein